jgi:hypothetical protein
VRASVWHACSTSLHFGGLIDVDTLTPFGCLCRWKADGLPSDSLSMQNAIVLLNFTEKVPFIIDPATSATHWLQHHLSKVRASLMVTVPSSCVAPCV